MRNVGIRNYRETIYSTIGSYMRQTYESIAAHLSDESQEYRKKKAPFHAVPPARGASAPLPPTGAAAAGAARGRLLRGLGGYAG